MRSWEVMEWIKQGKKDGDQCVVVISDSFSMEYYPIFCAYEEIPAIEEKYKDERMLSIREIIELKLEA